MSKASFQNIKTKWIPEVFHHCPGVPCVLVGTKIDLRDDSDVLEKLKQRGEEPVTVEQGKNMAKDIGAVDYLECSSLTGKGVRTVIEQCARIGASLVEYNVKE